MDEIVAREDAIKNVFAAFNRPVRSDVVKFIITKTSGVNITSFLDGCREIQSYNDIPKNISYTIIRLAGGEATTLVPCENCCVYIDETPALRGGERDTYAPGLRFYKNTYGTDKERIGHATFCNCRAGDTVRAKAGRLSTGGAPQKTLERISKEDFVF